MSDYKIRAASIEDIQQLTELYKSMYDGHGRDGLHMPFTLDLPALCELLPTVIRSKLCFLYVAELSGRLCGFISASVVRPERRFTMDGKMGLISDVFVCRPHRGHKLAERLLRSAEHWMSQSGVTLIECNVLSGNSDGLGFWRAEGYESMAEICYKYL